jgi:hypothetical protein
MGCDAVLFGTQITNVPDKPDTAGRTIAQAVSHRLPNAAAWVQTQVWSCGIL